MSSRKPVEPPFLRNGLDPLQGIETKLFDKNWNNSALFTHTTPNISEILLPTGILSTGDLDRDLESRKSMQLGRTSEEEWVMQTLKEYERQRCVSNVLRVQSEQAVKAGDNYASEVVRLSLDVMLKSGDVEKRSFITKNIPSNDATKEFIRSGSFFQREFRMFREVFPEMEKIRRVHTPLEEPLNATCYGMKGTEFILLEDLKAYGYEVAGDRRGLDFDHCKLVMEALAKYHAMTAVLIQNGNINVDELYGYIFERKREWAANVCENNFTEQAWILENKWKGEWVSYAHRMRKASETVAEKIMKLFDRDEKRFNTLLHGDMWTTNMMFRYGKDGKPANVRLLDFQLVWYNSVGFDIQYFMWTSALTEVRPRKQELIRVYHDCLTSRLRLYGYEKEPPCLESIEEDCGRAEFFGLVLSVSSAPFMLMPGAEVPDMERVSKDYSSKDDHASFVDRNKEEDAQYKKTMGYIIKDAARLGLI